MVSGNQRVRHAYRGEPDPWTRRGHQPAGIREEMIVLIRKAVIADLEAVAGIYEEIHRAEEAGTIVTGWIRGVYPTKATAEAALKRNDLFVLENNGKIYGSGIINQIQLDEYHTAQWDHQAGADQVCVLHTLTISPRAGRMGLGKQFVGFYETYALEHSCRELRIDTNERNLAARKMYKTLGYKEISIVPTMFNGIPDVNLVLLEKWLD